MSIKRRVMNGLVCVLIICLLIPGFVFAEGDVQSTTSENTGNSNDLGEKEDIGDGTIPGENSTGENDNRLGEDKDPEENKNSENEVLEENEDFEGNSGMDSDGNSESDKTLEDNGDLEDSETPEDNEEPEDSENSEDDENLENGKEPEINENLSKDKRIKKAAPRAAEVLQAAPTVGEDENGLGVISGTLDLTTLDVSNSRVAEKNSSGNGYIWEKTSEGYVLTLKNVCINGDEPLANSNEIKTALKLPGDEKVTIKIEGSQSSVLNGGISGSMDDNGYRQKLILCFEGSGNTSVLKVNGTIWNGVNNDQVIVQKGAQIAVTEGFSIGGSSGADSHLTVGGSGSTLTIGQEGGDGQTIVAHLQVAEGGKLISYHKIMVASTDSNKGTVEMDKDSTIVVHALPTFFSASAGTGIPVEGVLESIKPYLPVGYTVGLGTKDGTSYYTILDDKGQIAGELTLQDPPLGSTEEDPVSPEETTPPEKEPDSSEKTEGDSGRSGGSGHRNRRKNTSNSPQMEVTFIPEAEMESQVIALDAAPRTGDTGEARVWTFCFLCSAAVLCLFAGRYKVRKK